MNDGSPDAAPSRDHQNAHPTVAITGASGLVGTRLTNELENAGSRVIRMTRSAPQGRSNTVQWSPGSLDPNALDGVDAVVHLAGEPIAQRWTSAVKERIRDSRVEGTRTIAGALASMSRPPAVLVCASAIGYYGFRGDEELTESSAPGEGFLPEVCLAWEEAARPAAEAGIRVVHVRISLVLSPHGGALKKMLPPFRLGLGGRLGNGQQWMSWIALDDLVAVIRRALDDPSMQGAYNAAAPNPVRNAAFTKTLGRVLHRWTPFPVPGFALRLLFGEMSQVLLGSQRVLPRRLQDADFAFAFPQLEGALRHVLDKDDAAAT